ncbi:MAG: arginine--tRNA ligase [bacterium]|nr:arginine--tRNA ligase [bacterium]
MTKDKYKNEFATATAQAFREAYPDIFAEVGEAEVFAGDVIYEGLAKPKDPSMGRFAFPVFRYVRLLKEKPPEIAAKVAAATAWANGTSEAVAGFLNARIDPVKQSEGVVSEVLTKGSHYGDSDEGRGLTNLVEYSSPNIAKPFGMGHLRSTIIGNSLRKIYRKLGYDAVGINYPGDWGTQFGKMIVAYRKWGDNTTLTGNAVKNLLTLYVRYHVEAEKDTTLDDQSREAFQQLEAGEAEAVKLWEAFKDISNAEMQRVYDLLGVKFDWVCSESDLNDKMEPAIERMKRAGLTSISQGALVVHLEDEQLPPVLLKKGDGATLYATRDLAGLIYRWGKYPEFNKSLYVVNTAQSDHFKQCLEVIAMLEEAERIPADKRMTSRVKHVDFGWVRFAGKTMSTRGGNTVLLEDVISEATDLARTKIAEKNPDLADAEATSHMIGIGAVIFSQLSVRRTRDVDFRWEEILTFEGETGPYLQYTHARLCSLQRRYGQDVSPDVDFKLLSGDEEQRVIELLADFPRVIADSGEQYEPYFITAHLLRLAGAFNKVYQRKDADGNIDKIISDNAPLTAARMALVKSVQMIINEGLHLLGLKAPKEM